MKQYLLSVHMVAGEPEPSPEEMQQAYYAFGSAGGPSTMNFQNLLLSRSYAIGVRWRM